MNMANETISEKCETLYNKLNAFVTSVISRDVTPKISNLNTEVWGSDTQTGNSRIDTLNTNFNNLDGSITSMESDINNVKSDVSNLQTSVNSLSDSITNLIQVQDVVTSQASCQPGYSIDRTATVTACPEGYSALFIPRNSYRSVTRYTGLQGTTVSFNVTNISSATNNVGANGWLVYYPSSWNI